MFDANNMNALGEPRLTFISHEGGEPRAITKANAMTFGQAFLRSLSHHLLRVSELDAVYA